MKPLLILKYLSIRYNAYRHIFGLVDLTDKIDACYFDSLPSEIISHIFSYLDFESILR